tara:strand:+ start:227 stop:676 length:450 start_codon:yes stop_codon:yes gene_type:complete
MVDKTSRNEQVRAKKESPKQYVPPSALDAPPPPDGYRHRWIRAEFVGQEDRKNVVGRLNNGYELVRADEYPGWNSPTVDEGKHAGVIGVGGLLLARVPEELANSREEYFSNEARSQMEAVDNDLMREQHPSMPISKDRHSQVTFGNGRS